MTSSIKSMSMLRGEKFIEFCRDIRDARIQALAKASEPKVEDIVEDTVEGTDPFANLGQAVANNKRYSKVPPTHRPIFYHVTTAKDKVIQEGLKTRKELGMESGPGLSGGSDTSVSLTEDLDTAKAIYDGLIIARRFWSGEYTPADMMELARRGYGAPQPFDNFVERKLMLQSDLDKYLDPNIYEQKKDDYLWRWHFLNVWFNAREYAGGLENPYFTRVDTKALAATPEEQIAILEFEVDPESPIEWQDYGLQEFMENLKKDWDLDMKKLYELDFDRNRIANYIFEKYFEKYQADQNNRAERDEAWNQAYYIADRVERLKTLLGNVPLGEIRLPSGKYAKFRREIRVAKPPSPIQLRKSSKKIIFAKQADKYYHATFGQLFPQIMRTGLRAGSYFTPNPQLAIDHFWKKYEVVMGKRRWHRSREETEKRLKGLTTKKSLAIVLLEVEMEPEELEWRGGKYFVCKKKIPPQRIKFVGNFGPVVARRQRLLSLVKEAMEEYSNLTVPREQEEKVGMKKLMAAPRQVNMVEHKVSCPLFGEKIPLERCEVCEFFQGYDEDGLVVCMFDGERGGIGKLKNNGGHNG